MCTRHISKKHKPKGSGDLGRTEERGVSPWAGRLWFPEGGGDLVGLDQRGVCLRGDVG